MSGPLWSRQKELAGSTVEHVHVNAQYRCPNTDASQQVDPSDYH